MAPESIQQKVYSTKSDVWAFGVTMLEILTRQEPYPHLTGVEVVVGVATGKLQPQIPQLGDNISKVHPKLLQLIHRCFNPNPDMRPSFEEICSGVEVLV